MTIAGRICSGDEGWRCLLLQKGYGYADVRIEEACRSGIDDLSTGLDLEALHLDLESCNWKNKAEES